MLAWANRHRDFGDDIGICKSGSKSFLGPLRSLSSGSAGIKDVLVGVWGEVSCRKI